MLSRVGRFEQTLAVAGWEPDSYASGVAAAFADHSGDQWVVALLVAYGSWLLNLI